MSLTSKIQCCLMIISALVCLVACDRNNDRNTFTEISQRFVQQLNQLDNEPGITKVGFSSDPDEKLFKVGLGYDSNGITSQRLMRVIEGYVADSASLTPEADWKKTIKAYHLVVERIVAANTNLPVMAEKDVGSEDLIWKIK